MKIDELHEGRVFKNYKDLCSVLDIPIRSGNSKITQMKELERFCLLSRDGNKLVVQEVFDIPLPERKGRGGKFFEAPLSVTHPLLASEWDNTKNKRRLSDDITKMTKGYFWWICKKCNQKIYATINKRLKRAGKSSDMDKTCHYCNFTKGEKMVADYLIQKEIKFSCEYVFKELKGKVRHLRFDFAVLDDSDRVKYVIEYDGEFHYLPLRGESNLEILRKYDGLKNQFCEANRLPLLRIPFYDTSNFINNLSLFLSEVESGAVPLSKPPKEQLEYYLKLLSDLNSEILVHENTIYKIENETLPVLNRERNRILREISYLNEH